MPVFNVELIAPNGNRVTRSIVASDAGEAMDVMLSAHDVSPGDPSFSVVAREKHNSPELERMLVEAEARRLADEYYRMPVTTRRRR